LWGCRGIETAFESLYYFIIRVVKGVESPCPLLLSGGVVELLSSEPFAGEFDKFVVISSPHAISFLHIIGTFLQDIEIILTIK